MTKHYKVLDVVSGTAKRPVDHNGKTYYPTQASDCTMCEFFNHPGNRPCNNFRAIQRKLTKSDNVCWNDFESVIWRTGQTAQLEHLTERLTS